ncbi:MAG TPA: TonB-dependent receptor [Salinivirga sp.]|uniref:TonB-dependent receptor plug domain-containing protein n=1 Tax=Salinivirga sp. TaxID=1970192 RepID=UPI002B468F58|nr:TonB-dependent receptor [Salinivirga sp.]HKK58655.1 TonB-dependent receptor [Salinivirga sp.]
MKQFLRITILFILPFIVSISISAQEENLYEMDLESLMEIEIVSASKKAEDIFEAPLGASVLSSEQIKESGATSIMEALRLIPGLIVRETTPGNYDIHLRGYDGVDPKGLITLTANTMTLIMVNNRTVYSEFQGQTYWELLQINIDDVDRIEVVRGPVSAMYGPNAVAGVINILTKSPTKKKGASFSTYSMAGAPNSVITSTSAAYSFDNGLGIRLSGNADFRDRHKVDYFIFNENNFVDELNETEVTNILGLPVLDADQPYDGVYLAGPQAGQPIPNYNIHERYPDKKLATERYGGNLHMRYNKNDLDLNLMGGYSYARVQRVYANNNIAALSTDSLNTYFAHFWGSYKGLTITTDYSKGFNALVGSGELLKVNSDVLTATAEYDLKISENFSLKPGVSYKTSSYNSMGLGSTEQEIDPATFLSEGYEIVTPEDGGDVTNTLLSGHLQADYKWDRLRIIGAARVDKFQHPNKAAFSPLISATYKAAEDFLIRGSYGRSSRTPFIFDLFFDINLRYPTGTQYQGFALYNNLVYRGTERSDEIPGVNEKYNYKLLTVDDAEIGFRHRISETFTLDIELFWSQLNNLIALSKVRNDTIAGVNPLTGNETREAIEYYSFINLDMKPQQTGATMSLTSVPFKKMSFQIFVTVQQTKINDYADAIDVNGNPIDADGDGKKRSDFYHKATPAFTGGVNMNYRPTKKINLNLNSYFYSHQTLVINNEMNQGVVDANIILNGTINYKITDGIKIFATGRNLIGGYKRQYAFTDKIGPSVLGGVNINF